MGSSWEIRAGARDFTRAVLRYLIGLLPVGQQGGFPVKTLAINILGCLVIGLVVGAAACGGLGSRWELFLKVGVCGGFTTFSSFALECDQLLERGEVGMAALYVALSIVVGVAAAFAGQRLVA